MTGVIKSGSGQSDGRLAIQTTRQTLKQLEEKGAIVRVGEPDNNGTPYRVLLPEEIKLCQESMRTVFETEEAPGVDVQKDLDDYNIPENRLKVFERDSYQCTYCKKQLTRFTATLDHLQPVSKSGDNSLDNLVTACLHCNSRRGNRSVMEALVPPPKSDD